MCWGKVFTFGVPAHAATRCGHTKRRMIRCSNTDVCEEVAQEDTYTHAGECPDCLMGVVFPAHSYEQPEVERGRGLQSSTVLDACRQRAQQLVYFSVMWLVGGYDQAREVHDDGPLATNAAEQRRMDLVVLHHYLDTTRCVECGRRSLTAPCACPGVRAIEQSVANPAILFHHKVVRQIYRDQFLRGVQRGHYRDVMAQIEHGPRAPAPIKPEVAAQLLHRNRSASPNDILQRQNGLSTMVSEFYCELYSTRTESPDFGTWSEYTDLALQVMEVATWVLACDVGLPDIHKTQTLEFLRPMLIHPTDPRCPDKWIQFRDLMGPTDFSVYQTVLMGYMRLTQASEKLQILTDGLKCVLNTTMAEHKVAIDDSAVIYTREMLSTARVTYHSDLQDDPPSPDWECSVCLESGGPVLRLKRCGHCYHKGCLVEGLLQVPSHRNCCFYCRGSWDFLGVDNTEVTRHQTRPWRSDYGL